MKTKVQMEKMTCMDSFELIHRSGMTDLKMYHCGTEQCEAGHYYGPAVRDHFLIHYIHSGKGKFYVGDQVYPLQKGQGFLICPDIITFYQADQKDPWHYSWVGFHGIKAEACLKEAGLSAAAPIFTYDNDDFISRCLFQMVEAKGLQNGRETRLLGLLYLFLSQLMEQNGSATTKESTISRREKYVKKAVEYIEMNYSRKMSIAELAHHLGLDRSYLGGMFREKTGVSLQFYLMHYRIGKACELMKNEDLTIGDISRSVGYDDPLLFSKLFKRVHGSSPREYRKNVGK
jgi:AraC-like DNA-binding protein